MATFLHPIIEFLVKHGIPVSLSLYKGEIAFTVDGFYMSINATLVPNGENFKVIARDVKEAEIKDIRELAEFNLMLWRFVKTREFNDLIKPDKHWLPLLIELGMVKEKTIIAYEEIPK